MSDLDEFIQKRLEGMAQRPRMWAASREAFVAQITVLLDVSGHPDDGQWLHRQIFSVPGSCAAVGLFEHVEDEWARNVVEMARQIFRERAAGA
jgi:hypothetical protein